MELKADYLVFYSDIRIEDYYIGKSLFGVLHLLPPIFSESERKAWFRKTITECEQSFKENFQIIFFGFEEGWNGIAKDLKNFFKTITIKVIWNYPDSLLHEKFVRKHLFSVLSLSRKGIIDKIGFFRKSQFEVYSNLGYKSVYILENYYKTVKKQIDTRNLNVLGFFPLDNRWSRNIYNQLSVVKFLDKNYTLNYNLVDMKMADFVNTFEINSNPCVITSNNIEEVVGSMSINFDCSFSDCYHLVFFMSVVNGIPCILGNTEDFLPKKLFDFLVVSTEDEPAYIAQKIENVMKQDITIKEQLINWKNDYDKESEKSIFGFLYE